MSAQTSVNLYYLANAYVTTNIHTDVISITLFDHYIKISIERGKPYAIKEE